MSRRRQLLLLFASSLIFLSVGFLFRAPGYMDSEYYFVGAQRLAEGYGFTEPFIWNYLDDPKEIPHPSHTYWLPLTSLVAAASMSVLGISFRAAQLPFILLAILLPFFTVRLASRLHGDQKWAWQAGLLSLFSGFYLPYLLTTDTFTIYAWIGGGVLWLSAQASRNGRSVVWLCIGLLVGLAQLTRADGLLLLLPAMFALRWHQGAKLKAGLLVLLGCLIALAPWFVRNVTVIGRPFAPGTSRALWLLSYDEFFSYPADLLSPARWWDSGIAAILGARIQALGINLQRLMAENGLLFLGPFMAIGAFHLRSKRLVRLCAFYLVILLGVMSFIFPFAGSNGGFFHSGAAAMPVLWALAPVGVERAVEWAARRRKWDRTQAKAVFGASSIVFAFLISMGLIWSKVVGQSLDVMQWNSSFESYRALGVQLRQLDSAPGRVAVNNPPGFYLATGIEAVVVPNVTPDMLKRAVRQYDVRWVILDANRPQELAQLFDKGISPDWTEAAIWLDDIVGRRYQLLKVAFEVNSP